jgi:UDP-N-acetylmuramoylalanine--D-glutamate ligase
MNQVLVLGFGISGKAAAAFLKSRGLAVLILDRKADPSEGVLPDRADFPLEGFSQVILSPGIPRTHPIVQRALASGIEVIGEIELAFRHIRNRCIGITGSNGKTTTVLLVAHILNQAGKKAQALGNVGVGLTSYLLHPDEKEILVVELSSFQLETLQARCLDLAAILNITPNHLDRYSSMQEYAEAKKRIVQCLKENGRLFVSRKVQAEWGPFDAVVFDPEEKSVAPISIPGYIELGVPEKQNVQIARLLCAHFGVTDAEFNRGLQTFRKPPHRIEWVADVGGVSYYNDSKSSNIDSVMHAIRLFERPIVLIAGGVDKGASYCPWISCFEGKVKKIVAYGQASAKMERELAIAFPFQRVETLKEAVISAIAAAEKEEIVLLSPGCSSYDQFRNYEERGQRFKELLGELLGV